MSARELFTFNPSLLHSLLLPLPFSPMKASFFLPLITLITYLKANKTGEIIVPDTNKLVFDSRTESNHTLIGMVLKRNHWDMQVIGLARMDAIFNGDEVDSVSKSFPNRVL